MNRVRILATLTLAAACGVASQSSRQAAEAEVLRAEKERVAAVVARDTPTLERLLADDLTYTHSSAFVESKAEFLRSIQTGELIYEFIEHSDLLARVYGSSAVLTGRSALRVRSPRTQGQPQNFEIRFTTVYVKQEGRWRQVAWQSTRVPTQP